MKTICVLLFVALVTLALLPGCATGPNADRGTAGGAVAGAVLGGIIGHQSGETGAGAAIGAAAGGLAGNAYGHSKDNADYYASQGRDQYGYSSGDYLALLNPREHETLENRARGSDVTDLAAFLTPQEKANLRARAASQNEIGRSNG